MQYWLMKSEPNAFGIDDLRTVRREPWDGVRNYQARNFMRDVMQVGDLAFFYHSNCNPPGIVGVMQIACAAYPDPTQFDPDSKYFDPKSHPDKPRWSLVDVEYKRHFKKMLSLDCLREQASLQSLVILRPGNRLSITPVTCDEWHSVLALEQQMV